MKTPPNTSNKTSRTRDIMQACIGLVIGLSIAAYLYFEKNHIVVALAITFISISIALCALFIPRAHQAIQKFFSRLSHWIGQGIAFLLLVPLFFLFFVPVRFIRSLMGKDPLRLRSTGQEKTFWEPREKVELSQYRRQF